MKAETEYIPYCAEHHLPLQDGRCPKCRDASGNSFVLDMQSTYLVNIYDTNKPTRTRRFLKRSLELLSRPWWFCVWIYQELRIAGKWKE